MASIRSGPTAGEDSCTRSHFGRLQIPLVLALLVETVNCAWDLGRFRDPVGMLSLRAVVMLLEEIENPSSLALEDLALLWSVDRDKICQIA